MCVEGVRHDDWEKTKSKCTFHFYFCENQPEFMQRYAQSKKAKTFHNLSTNEVIVATRDKDEELWILCHELVHLLLIYKYRASIPLTVEQEEDLAKAIAYGVDHPIAWTRLLAELRKEAGGGM